VLEAMEGADDRGDYVIVSSLMNRLGGRLTASRERVRHSSIIGNRLMIGQVSFTHSPPFISRRHFLFDSLAVDAGAKTYLTYGSKILF
jgi:hypothetical protein